MNSATTLRTSTSSPSASIKLGVRLGHLLKGGEIIELSSDLGGGKTTFVKGLAKGLGYDGEIVSPTFTVSRIYDLPRGLSLYHFDFYRLEPGDVAAAEMAEAAGQPQVITVIEWAGQVGKELPQERLVIEFEAVSPNERNLTITGPARYQNLIKELRS